MAPRKRKAEVDGEVDAGKSSAVAPATRRSTRLAKSAPEPAVELPKKKKGKATGKKGKEKKKTVEEKQTETEEAKEKDEEEEANEATDADKSKKTVVVEHCKQCNSFKTRAVQVKTGIEKAVPGVSVVLNPEKPRRGCFEIREEGGEKFISLLDMERPFKPMKALNMDQVIADVIDKIK
ncbi:hypothetical protein K2173_000296 [Erythroxylum novogranatense]|uniref:Selenoprotein H n=1 Tax=Erythroxylum novogranatense TaxID=1862640 RepID=A0AAV8SVY7_9ROSI|nr:hypothetical protein K2173_000296 [Erythroxylum novogranatense]